MRRATLLGAVLSLLLGGSRLPAADNGAGELIDEALHREIYGLHSERQRLLQQAAQADPDSPQVMWHRGFVRHGARWLPAGQVPAALHDDRSLTRYAQRRAEADTDSVDDQLALANWCRSQRLEDQERAHLSRVVDLAPDHLGARQRLGFVPLGDSWVLKQDIQRARQQRRRQLAVIHKHRSDFQKLARAFQSENPQRASQAEERLMRIDDPAVIPALEAWLTTSGPQAASAVVEALGRIPSQEAVDSLVRHALFVPWPAVREAAAEQLRPRQRESYVPQLLSALQTPVTSRMQVVGSSDGRLIYRHVFERETRDQRNVMVLDTSFRRVAVAGGSAAAALRDAVADLGGMALQRMFAASRDNIATGMNNRRLTWLLQTATEANPGAAPQDWWDWWNQENEVYISGDKTVRTVYSSREEVVVDQVVTGATPSDCFVAGTVVWTSLGPRPIEQVTIGDLVLSQSAATGELAYKPVLRTSQRPRGELIVVRSGEDRLACSGGHLFWVSGAGWVKSRQLRSGMMLHTPAGSVQVDSVERQGQEPTFNVVVADFHTYFAGHGRILCHDNTVRRPTSAVVPGLTLE